MDISTSDKGLTQEECTAVAAKFFLENKDRLDLSVLSSTDADEDDENEEYSKRVNSLEYGSSSDSDDIELPIELKKKIVAEDILISDCIGELLTSGKLVTKHLFLSEGNRTNMKALVTQYDSFTGTVTEPIWDLCSAHDIAEVLVLRLTNLEPPLISIETMEHCLNLYINQEEVSAEEICQIVRDDCPSENQPLMNKLFNFLHIVSHFAHINGCTKEILAQVFAQVIIQDEELLKARNQTIDFSKLQEVGMGTEEGSELEPEFEDELSRLLTNANKAIDESNKAETVSKNEENGSPSSEGAVLESDEDSEEQVEFDILLVQTLLENFELL